ncbi:MAG: MarR family winged helix-turn-helix transcriptional regulator [Anaerococcus hydrogenalis]|uniref:MarR family winged helix-turn-helix transcriptional regulator n=1 Tax=Anaerococcus hydrogenalis TaxID=33029 RepID=UPI00290149DD|nr:MarR family winged helix-turn-helix transcriptional regulator [Anaerococcus hydrogenalis]MDU3152914.1 MarR family winged helix-turn-helix transcriptional regulator [Anaerococcus hydrogenalis]MDU3199018.1 MarR family winged helix-turn-helix transcriptional regulator [Anaerococcus hydrogenalis]MDU3688206.1 MarR family winged helix-turn-helix transcriptional regulator [Anaerococcus hydrogenalis]
MKKDKSLEIFNLFSLIRKVQGLKNQSFKDRKANGIKTAIFLFLIYEDKITQAMIVERMAVAKQTINNVIIELCEKEYIKKISDQDDKRVKILVLTEKGKIYADEFLKPLIEFNEKLYDKLGEEKINQMTKDFSDLAEILCKFNKEEI